MKPVFLFLVLFAASVPLKGQQAVILDPVRPTYEISDRVSVLTDKTGKLSFEDVRESNAAFVPSKGKSFNFGYSETVYWIKGAFVIPPEAPTGNWVLETEFPWFYSFDLYMTGWNGKTDHVRQIKKQPFGTRMIQYRSFTLPLKLGAGTNEFLIRVSGNPLHFNLKASRENYFHEMVNGDHFLLGIYYGIIVLIVLISVLLFIRIQETVYIYSILYTASAGLLQFTLNGLSFQYLWPNAVAWHEMSTNFLPGLSILMGAFLARKFLGTRKNTPVMDIFLYLVQAIAAADMVCALLNLQLACLVLINMIMIGVPVLFIAMGIACLKRGFYPARYFLLTFVLQAVLLIVYALKDQGFLPNNILTDYGIQLSILAQVLFLSLAMFDRYNLTATEREKLQKDMHIHLEEQIKDKTRELVRKQDERNDAKK